MEKPSPTRRALKTRSRPSTVPEQIAAEVNAAVMRGEYLPGDPIREQELADAFSVSRGPVREALRILEKTGVVTIVPLKGAHVTRISKEELDRFFEIRRALVPLLPRYLLERNVEVIESLEHYVDRLLSLAENESTHGWDAYVQTVYDLNRAMCEACRNPQLENIWMTIFDQTARYTRLGLRDPARRAASAKGWKALMQALKLRDDDEATALLRGLISASRRAAIAMMDSEPG
ncbi:MAG: GntR family transcriptional regulator [Burkholderiales bacterium]|nr:GntR family transcriptional regulator [Burkholderiales bacterium]